MDASSLQPKEPVQLQSSAQIEAANQNKAVWVCRVLSLFAALLACIYARADHSLTALAFAALGIGFAAVIIFIRPEDREWVVSVAIGGASLAITHVLLHLVGLR